MKKFSFENEIVENGAELNFDMFINHKKCKRICCSSGSNETKNETAECEKCCAEKKLMEYF